MLPAWIDRQEYPFSPRKFTLPVGEMSYLDEGQGEPLLMIHGNPSWSFEFRHLIKSLSAHCRCLAPDHIGFGLSDKPQHWGYLPQQHADNLEVWLEALDLEEITMVVGDWGGPLGLSYAICHPDRVKQIVITNTWMWSVRDDWYYQFFSRFVGGAVGRWLIRRYNFFASTILKATFGDREKLTPEIHQHYLKPFSNPQERTGTHVFPRQIIGSSEWLQSLWEQRDTFSGKVKLIAWGMKDIAFREKELNRWCKAFPAAKGVRFPSAGHFLTEELPRELTAELNDLLGI